MTTTNTAGRLSVQTMGAETELRDSEGNKIAALSHEREEHANRLAASWNACEHIPTDAIEEMPKPGVIGMMILVKRLHAAVAAYEAARDAMFAQCLSNPVYDTWGKEVSMAKFNEAHLLAREALG